MKDTGRVRGRMEDRLDEQKYLLAVLGLWEAAAKAGHKSEDVKAFSFRQEFLNPANKRHYQDDFLCRKAWGDKYHNCVRLKTGELKGIPLTEKPVTNDSLRTVRRSA